MDLERLPPQLHAVLTRLAQVVNARGPAIRTHVNTLRAQNPHLTNEQLARALIRSTRRRVSATAAVSGVSAIAPGLGTVLAIGTITSQALYALEQEVELTLAIAMVYGHELTGSDERVIESLIVIGLASGAVKVREEILVAGGERVALAVFRRMPAIVITHGGGRMLSRVLTRFASTAAAKVAARIIPLAVGVAAGAGFDWVAVTGLGRVAMRYYGPGGPGARPLLLAPEDPPHVELGR